MKKMFYFFSIIIFIIFLSICSLKGIKRIDNVFVNQNIKTPDSQYIVDLSGAESISSVNSWVESVTPANESTVDSETNISIVFKHNMDENSLNSSSIVIEECKHSSNISKLFNYKYDKTANKLDIVFKIPGNSYGTGNSVVVYLNGSIKDIDGKLINKDYYFTFYT